MMARANLCWLLPAILLTSCVGANVHDPWQSEVADSGYRRQAHEEWVELSLGPEGDLVAAHVDNEGRLRLAAKPLAGAWTVDDLFGFLGPGNAISVDHRVFLGRTTMGAPYVLAREAEGGELLRLGLGEGGWELERLGRGSDSTSVWFTGAPDGTIHLVSFFGRDMELSHLTRSPAGVWRQGAKLAMDRTPKSVDLTLATGALHLCWADTWAGLLNYGKIDLEAESWRATTAVEGQLRQFDPECSIAATESGRVDMAFAWNQELHYARLEEAGGDWRVEEVAEMFGWSDRYLWTGSGSSIEIRPDGSVDILASGETKAGLLDSNFHLLFAHRDGGGEWTARAIQDLPKYGGRRHGLVVDKSGTLHVLHSDTFYFERGLAHSWWNETKIGAGQD